MGKLTRKEWALVYGVDYQTMANALHNYTVQGRRIPNQQFDQETVRSALAKYYADRRVKHLERAARLEKMIEAVLAKEV